MSARKPDPLDVVVGAKIRIFRTDRGLSQTALADAIGVTFQQVQKYESGTNRVGAGRLSRIAVVLGVSIGQLFESSDDAADATSPFRLLIEPGALRLLKAFSRTSDPRVRRGITLLLESLADQKFKKKSAIRRPAAVKRGEQQRKVSSMRP
ncbi:MAG TPA: helix-turn-helix transcriptional regulator [Steroidobacteraceae bacterium]